MCLMGKDFYGEFGMDNKDDNNKFIEHNRHEFKRIISGNSFNIFIDENDNYWSVGDNKHGLCGVGKKDKIITKLTEIAYFKKNK